MTSEYKNNESTAAAEILETSPEIIKENLPNVPTPFKRVLFWKTPPEEKKKSTKKPKEKIPAVVVSEDWQEYEKRKLEKKEKILEEKEKRKKERVEKEHQRRILKKQNAIEKRKKGKTTKTNAIILSDSDTETDNIIVSTEFDIDIGDYVIVKYNEAHFPGCVTNIISENESKEYTVKAMESSGQNWKWPAKEDVLNYQRKDVIIKIEKPKLINKRGFYAVPELKDF